MGTLQFNGILANADGTATITIVYVNGDTGSRTAQLSVNGGPALTLSFPKTGGWSTTGTLTIGVRVRQGTNTLKFFNNTAAAPDFDMIRLTGVKPTVRTAADRAP
jgi:hypothetical protein